MIPVSSSDIRRVGYNATTRLLCVEFYSGTYNYYDVRENVYQGLMSASSKGRYLHAYIKNSYRYIRV